MVRRLLVIAIIGIGVILGGLWCSNPVSSDELGIEFIRLPHADESQVPDSLKKAYIEDAGILTLHIVQEVGSEVNDQVELPNELLTALYNALIYVYNATDLAARDSVVDMYDIHVTHTWAIRSLIVAIDSTKAWTQAWRKGERFTGQQQIDWLMVKYGLELEKYYEFPWGHTVTLASSRPINMAALAKRFAAIKGVTYAEPNGGIGDGPGITAQAGTDHWLLTYSLGWGDCPSGCIDRHYWYFEVSTSGEVTYTGSSGTPIPELITY